jgi:MscS family membrane protein
MHTFANKLIQTAATTPPLPSWLEHWLPPAMGGVGPFGLHWWQWAIGLPVIFIAICVGLAASWAVRRTLTAIARRTSASWDDDALQRLRTPITLGCTIAAVSAFVPILALDVRTAAIVLRLIRVAFGGVMFWGILRLVDIGRTVTANSHWARSVPASRSLVPLGARVAKVAVGALGLVVILSTLGYPVTSLIAGLGIGGLAFALAAQKTVENLFGAFSIGVDQPFREGDFVKVDDFVGTVEAIGLRSTRFRTLDRTIVTLPNGRLADMRLESFAARDRLRLAAIIGLTYDTTRAQMLEVLSGFERVLRAHPKIWPDAVVVRFGELSASSLNIEVMAWFQTVDWGEFQRIREGVLLDFMGVVEDAGASFAFPTQTIHIAGGASARGPGEFDHDQTRNAAGVQR